MRTEVKLGIAIGFLVVAGVAGYFIWSTGGKDKQSAPATKAPEAIRIPPRSSVPLVVSSADKPYSGSSATSAPASAPALAINIPTITVSPATTGSAAASHADTTLANSGRRLSDLPSSTTKPASLVTLLPSVATNGSYTVVAGDNGYWTIAEKVYGKGNGKYHTLIEKANKVDSSHLRVGQQLVIPPLPTEAGKTASASPLAASLSNTAISSKSLSAGDASGSSEEYVVKSGDTGWSIAQKMYGNGTYWPLISKANQGVDPKNLKIGQKLQIPPKPGSTASASNTTPIRTSSAAPTSRPSVSAADSTSGGVVLPRRPDFGS